VSGKIPPSSSASVTHHAGEDTPVETRFGRKQEIVIGRDFDCDVVIKDQKASRKHCRLLRKAEGFVLEDLGSKNGTFFEGKKIAGPVTLRAEQAFKIGDTIFYLSQ
jgi:pSer/pThr/pTyr-binding forkhead associated (FHA) protein